MLKNTFLSILLFACTPGTQPELTDTGVDSDSDSDTDSNSVSVASFTGLSLISDERVPDCSIWNGLSYDGEHVRFTTNANQHLQLRTYDTDFTEVADRVQVTFDEDVPEDAWVTDHFHQWVPSQERLYLTWSTPDAENLYLIALDSQGQRIGEQITVAENSESLTNDMQMSSDSTNVYVWWGNAGRTHMVQGYDTDLNPISDAQTVSLTTEVPQLGSHVFQDEEFVMFTGDGPQRNLMASFYDSSFTPKEPFQKTLLPTESDDWNWAASGSLYSSEYGIWVVGFTHMYAEESADQDATVRVAVFDNTFSLLEEITVSESGFGRPHVLVVEDELWVGYDRPSEVRLARYSIQAD